MSNICCRDASEQVLLPTFHSSYISNDKSPEDLVSSLPGKFVRIKVEGGIHTRGVSAQSDDTETGLDRPKWMSQARCNSAKSVMSDYTQNTTTSTTSAIKSIVISPSSSPRSSDNSSPIYFIEHSDPCAKQSRTIYKSKNMELKNKLNGNGDGDIWIEKRCFNKKTGKKRFLFVSENTGVITREPPTGASRVLYADELVSEELMKEHLYDVDQDGNEDLNLDYHTSDDSLTEC